MSWLGERVGSLVPWLGLLLWSPIAFAVAYVLDKVVHLSAPWAAVVGASLAAAGDQLRDRLQGSLRRQQKEAELIRTRFRTQRKRLPKVSGLTATDVGVHGAQWLDTSSAGLPPDTPLYVSRDIHQRLVRQIRAGGRVLIEGHSAAGKTRTAYEAVREAVPGHTILIPSRSEPALSELVRRGLNTRRSVIWLDDLEQYLKAGTVDENVLTTLCPPAGSDVAIVATLRTGELKALQDGESDGSQLIRTADGVLNLFYRHALSNRMSETELTRARDTPDPRIASALQGAREGRIPEYLAAVPAVLRHWQQASDEVSRVGAAAVWAAVDCRRAGLSRPVPGDTLERLLPGYLDPGQKVPPELWEDALRWATTAPPDASSACLTRLEDAYLASDFLVDHVQTNETREIPKEVWDSVLELSRDNTSNLSVSRSARTYGQRAVSEQALRRVAEAGDVTAMNNLGVDLHQRDELAAAQRWYEKAAMGGSTDAKYNLGVLTEQRNSALAEKWYRRAADQGHAAAMNNLGVLLRRSGRGAEGLSWLRRSADLGGADAQANLRDGLGGGG